MGIFIPLLIAFAGKKVNKETCQILHLGLGKDMTEVKDNIKDAKAKIDKIAESVIRIEAHIGTKIE